MYMSEIMPSRELDLEALLPVEGGSSLTFEGFMEHKFDPTTGREYLVLDPETPYPIPDHEDMLDDLVLPVNETSTLSRYIALPQQYKTLEQVLKDATPTSADKPSEAIEEANAIFTQLGDEFTNLVNSDGVLPTDIAARQLIVICDGDWRAVKILPPLRVNDVDTENYHGTDVSMMLKIQLYNSLHYRVSSKDEKVILPKLFKSFVRAFSYEHSEYNDKEPQSEVEDVLGQI